MQGSILRGWCAAWLALALGSVAGCRPVPTALDNAVPIADLELPAPAVDVPPSESGELQTAVFAGGCFWSVEAVFEHVKGVVRAVSGYTGGTAATARYDLVVMGDTEHAEAVEIVFDPNVVSYGQLLHIFLAVAHDPTQLDRQGPDAGRMYRSNIFYRDDAQRDITRAYFDQLAAARVSPAPIVTRLDPLDTFYPAEREHQNYVINNWTDRYVVTYSRPKLRRLDRLFPALFRKP